MTEIYMDNAATTRCSEAAARAVERALRIDFGNPSSLHKKGYEAEVLLKEAKKLLADTLGADPKEIIITSGGTEADNLAITGCARAGARRGKHLITTAIEHPAVARTMEALKKEGFEITVVPVDAYGLVDPVAVADAVREDTVLVSVMAVNNEVGSVQDIAAIGSAVKEKAPWVLFHTDAVQAYGKVDIDIKGSRLDLVSVSAHKIHGPKGAGFLYVKKGTRIEPIIHGGGQQDGLRSGTDHVPGAVGMAAAAEEIFKDIDPVRLRVAKMRERLAMLLIESVPDIRINGPAGADDEKILDRAAPHILSVSAAGVRAEVLLHALEDEGICVSAGSACSSHSRSRERGTATLRAMGLPEKYLESTVRFSLSGENTDEEVEAAAQAVSRLVPALRRFS